MLSKMIIFMRVLSLITIILVSDAIASGAVTFREIDQVDHNFAKSIAFSFLHENLTLISTVNQLSSTDPDCVLVVRDNLLSKSGCSLPAFCGHIQVTKLPTVSPSWFYQDSVTVCLAFRQTSVNYLVYNFSSSFHVTLTEAFKSKYNIPHYVKHSFATIQDLFFETFHLYIDIRGAYAFLPKYCITTPVNDITLSEDSSKFCFSYKLRGKRSCHPIFFTSFFDLLHYHNLPIGFSRVSTQLPFQNFDRYYVTGTHSLEYVGSIGRSSAYLYGDYGLQPLYIYSPLDALTDNFGIYPPEYCLPEHFCSYNPITVMVTHAHNFLNHILHLITTRSSNFLAYIEHSASNLYSQLKKFLKQTLSDIFDATMKLLWEIFTYLCSIIPVTIFDELCGFFLVFPPLFLYYQKFYYSLIVSAFFVTCKLLSLSLIFGTKA
nr:glycoprotein [Whitefly negevirus 1]